jgi:hypothetical protein
MENKEIDSISESTLFEAVGKYVKTNGTAPKKLLSKKIEDNILIANNRCMKSHKVIEKCKKTMEKMTKDVNDLKIENARLKSILLQSLV